MSTEFDAIVLGGGPGGYPCAIRLGQLGQTVACVEEEEYGGVCLNWRCIQSKMQVWRDGIVKKLTSGVRGLLKGNGATVIEGRGRLIDARTVEVTGKNGKQ